MYIKKTYITTGGYLIGKLIETVRLDIPCNKSQEWIIDIIENHGYHCDDKIIIPTGDPYRHKIKVYKNYASLVADVL